MDEWSLKKRQEAIGMSQVALHFSGNSVRTRFVRWDYTVPGRRPQEKSGTPMISVKLPFSKAQKIKAINSKRAELLREQKVCSRQFSLMLSDHSQLGGKALAKGLRRSVGEEPVHGKFM